MAWWLESQSNFGMHLWQWSWPMKIMQCNCWIKAMLTFVQEKKHNDMRIMYRRGNKIGTFIFYCVLLNALICGNKHRNLSAWKTPKNIFKQTIFFLVNKQNFYASSWRSWIFLIYFNNSTTSVLIGWKFFNCFMIDQILISQIRHLLCLSAWY